MSDGILMIPMGGKTYIEEAHVNLRAIRRISDLPITLYTNQPEEFQGDGFFHRSLHEIALPNPRGTIQVCQCEDFGGFKNQSHYLSHTPYQSTVHLDCDAVPIHETAFQPLELLGRYHFAATLAYYRPFKSQRKDIPVPYTQWNCGVMFYSQEMLPIFRAWNHNYSASESLIQRVLARLIWDHPEILVYTLAPEWNYRGGLCASVPNPPSLVRIAHGHSIPRMIDSEGRFDERAFQEWFYSRTISRLQQECRVVVCPRIIRNAWMSVLGRFARTKTPGVKSKRKDQ